MIRASDCRITRPVSLPALALPPEDRSQISEMSGLSASILRIRSGRPVSTAPSASKTLVPPIIFGVSSIFSLVDQFGAIGQVGFSGSMPGFTSVAPKVKSEAMTMAVLIVFSCSCHDYIS
ncbi:hypothetical protein [Sphingopyxis sp. BSNA05]|uniref:hypothetical protein n=1 Tax=Sphingopyxis sp. BSNA05 TaxID=1236614 RepID=UPI0020B64140|nr:hypothetical protein [Sphingopyxis sp. BSNA05]